MSNIQWTELTWNPTIGCSEVSPGCRECYAAKMAHRLAHMPQQKENYAGLTKKLPNGRIVWTGVVKEMPERLLSVFNNKKPTTYFVDSMSDLFHDDVSSEFIDRVMVIMKITPWHTYQVLTKRSDRMLEYFSSDRPKKIDEMVLQMMNEGIDIPSTPCFVQKDGLFQWPMNNVWLGVSVEDEKRKRRIDDLIKVPAAIRFLSCEPLLEKIDLLFDAYLYLLRDKIDWVIVGGESGSNHRPCQLEWIESIVEQCEACDMPVFVKQLGSYQAKRLKLKDGKGGNIDEWPEHLRKRQFPVLK